jgi:hypothetical protein
MSRGACACSGNPLWGLVKEIHVYMCDKKMGWAKEKRKHNIKKQQFNYASTVVRRAKHCKNDKASDGSTRKRKGTLFKQLSTW